MITIQLGSVAAARLRRLAGALTLGAAALGASAPAQAQTPNPNSKLCFRDAFGIPGFVKPPVIDGCLRACSYPSDSPTQHDDFGWTDAFQFVANPYNATTQAGDVVVRGVRNGSSRGLDLSYEVSRDTRLDDDDAIVIALKGNVAGAGQGKDYALLVVYPFLNGAGNVVNGAIPHSVGPTQIGQIKWYQGTGGATSVAWDNTFTAPNWVTAAVNSGTDGTKWNWTVEVHLTELPVEGSVGVDYNDSGFRFFTDVIQVYDENSLSAFDFPWPPAAVNGSEVDPTLTPALAQWGVASVNTGTCGGVSFSPNDIHTNQPIATQISKTSPNIFSVTVKNTMIDTRPGPNQNKPAVAPDVTASFRIANFGLPSNLAWTPIPNGNDVSNPTPIPAATTNPANSAVPPGTIAAAGSATLSGRGPGWTPDPAWTSANSGHQCILAELSSPSNDVLFLNRAAYQNMNYGTNPGIDPTAFIDGRWGTPPQGKTKHTIDLVVYPEVQFAYADGTVPDLPIGKLTAQMQAVYFGYRHTGRYVPLNKKYELVTPIGYFGYFVQHELALDVETKFNERHAEISGAAARLGKDAPQRYAALNAKLASDSDKPALTDWQLTFPKLQPVGRGGNLLRIELGPEEVSRLEGTIKYLPGGTIPHPPGGGCGCLRTSTSSVAAPLMGFIVVVSAGWRRRNRNRSKP